MQEIPVLGALVDSPLHGLHRRPDMRDALAHKALRREECPDGRETPVFPHLGEDEFGRHGRDGAHKGGVVASIQAAKVLTK